MKLLTLFLGEIKDKFSKIENILIMNKPFFESLGLKKSFFYISLCFIYSLLSTLNYVALLPLLSIISSSSQEIYNNFFLPWIPTLRLPFIEKYAFLILLSGVFIVYVLKFLVGLVVSRLAGVYGENYMNTIRTCLLKEHENRRYFRTSQDKADYLYVLSLVPKVGAMNWVLVNFCIKVTISFFSFLFAVLLFPKLALGAFLFICIWAAFLIPLLKVSRRETKKYLDSLRLLNNFFSEQMNAIDVIRIFNIRAARDQERSNLYQKIVQSNVLVSVSRQATGSIQEILVLLFIIVLIFFLRGSSIDLAELITFGFVFSRALGNLNESSSFFSSCLEALPAAEQLDEYGVLKPNPTTEDIIDSKINNSNDFSLSEIRLIQFSAALESGKVKPVDGIFKPGDKIHITGRNGLGKSTFLKAILGLLPYRGQIVINGVLNSINPSWLSYVPQHEMFFTGPLHENIILSNSSIQDFETLLSDLCLNLEDFFVDWRNYKLQDNGENLSGGQKQIISILRALMKNAPILILDEYANHLAPDVIGKFDSYFDTLNDKVIFIVSHLKPRFINKTIKLEEVM